MFRILILVLALGSGGVAAWLALGASGEEQPAAAAVVKATPVPSREVLVASADIGHGAPIDSASLKWQAWPGDVPAVFINREARPTAVEELEGATARGGFVSGEPIREDRIAKAGSRFLSGQLASGKRAIAVRVTAESTAGGFILPGDRVDVIHTKVIPGQSDGQSEVLSQPILSNVHVLAVDQTAADADGTTTVVGKTATLEVGAEHIPVIAAAEASGTISLALRAAGDASEAPSVKETKAKPGLVRLFQSGSSTLIEVPSSQEFGS